MGEITVITDDLNEAATFLIDGNGNESLIIQGADAQGDDYTVSLDGGGNVQITDNTEAVTITTTGIDGANDRLVLRTLGGDDELTVDVDGTVLIDVLISYEGGSGSDLLTVTGTSTDTVDTAIFSPGPVVDAGRLTYDTDDALANPNMIIDFTGLEPVVDLVVAGNLVVNGTNADNAINYMRGPNAGTGVVIAGTVTAAASALAFTDAALIVAPVQPMIGDVVTFTSGANITESRTVTAFNPGTGEITVGGAFSAVPAVADTFTFVNLDTGLVSVDGFETIEFSNKTNLTINGLAGSDVINLNNPPPRPA